MIDERRQTPFLCVFAVPLHDMPTETLRYDQQRQVSQVLIGQDWVDTPDAQIEPVQNSRITRVRPETSDEQ
jgi:hypothetical protein